MNINKKLIRNLLDVLIKNTTNNGILYYQITINFLNNDKSEESIDFINCWKNDIKNLNKIILNIDILCLTYYCHELSELKKPHIHIVLGLKSILGYNNLIKDNLFSYFLNNGYNDIKVDDLPEFLDIKNFFNYMWKDLETTIFNHDFILYDHKFLNSFIALENCSKKDNLKINFIICDKNENYKSINKQQNIFNEYTLINLINFYFFYKNLHWNNDIIYEKVNNTILSYKKLYRFKDIIENIDLIYNELLNTFKIQLTNLDLYTIKIKYLKHLDYYCEKPENIFINNIQLSFDFLEFKDGVYIIKNNYFIKKEKLLEYSEQIKIKSIGTTKYYNKLYKWTKNKIPSFWLNQIKETLNDNEIEDFICYFISIFYKKVNLLGKKRILYIYGAPNTKKSTLTAQILINFYGLENIGLISKNKNFLFENLLNKEIAIFDECEHYDIPIDVLLKILEGSDIIIDQKFKKPVLLSSLNLIMLSNNKLEDVKNFTEIIKKAIETRIKYVKFNNVETDLKTLTEINEKLIQEEPHIIIYCNNILHKKFFQTKIKKNNNIIYLLEEKT